MRTPIVLLVTGAALGIFGLLWAACALVSANAYPIEGYAEWNLPAGIALVLVGLVMAVRGWVLRRR